MTCVDTSLIWNGDVKIQFVESTLKEQQSKVLRVRARFVVVYNNLFVVFLSFRFESLRVKLPFRVCAVSEKFGDISNPSALVEMDSYLLDKSYLSDNIPSQLDVSAFELLQKSATKQLISQYFNLSRWFNHIQTFVNEFEFLPEACF